MWNDGVFIVLFALMLGAIIGLLMMLWNDLKEKRTKRIVTHLFEELSGHLESEKDYIVDTMVELVDVTIDKMPDWTEKVKESIEKM